MKIRWLSVAVLGTSALVGAMACSGTAVHDVGDVTAGAPGIGGESNVAGAPGTAGGLTAGAPDIAGAGNGPNGAAGAPGATIVGTWRGYVENFKNTDNTDSVELRIDDATGAGHVVFGDEQKRPAPTDPAAEYPPHSDTNEGGFGDQAQRPYAGFAYVIRNASVTGSRLRFDIARNEVYDAICAIQTAYEDEANADVAYFCLPNWGFDFGDCTQVNPKTNTKVARTCFQMQLCSPGGACECTAKSCIGSTTVTSHFDLSFTVNTADGSASGLDPASIHNVRLTQAPK